MWINTFKIWIKISKMQQKSIYWWNIINTMTKREDLNDTVLALYTKMIFIINMRWHCIKISVQYSHTNKQPPKVI